MSDARAATQRVPPLLLRTAWWGAVTLLGLHLIIWPGLLNYPSTHLGSSDGNSADIRWVPIALLLWILIGGRWGGRSRPAERLRGLVSGLTVILVMIAACGAAVLLTKLMATLVGALIA